MLPSLHICFLFLDIDRVFRGDCSTRQVYEEGAREIALSVVSGINCEYKYTCLLFYNSFFRMTTGKTTATFFFIKFFSKYFCIWANKQWENLHHEWYNRVFSGGYI